MRGMNGATTAAEAIRQRLGPALEAIDENVRQGRRLVVRGRHAAEDAFDASALQVRRHPLGAVALAAGTGALAGCLIGFALGRLARCA
jgi:ElaB/YqjD/DUF883 family membrane-anchored ribosome-binding protein